MVVVERVNRVDVGAQHGHDKHWNGKDQAKVQPQPPFIQLGSVAHLHRVGVIERRHGTWKPQICDGVHNIAGRREGGLERHRGQIHEQVDSD